MIKDRRKTRGVERQGDEKDSRKRRIEGNREEETNSE